MKLATSTGDFWFLNDNYYDAIMCFKDTKFKNINLELTKNRDVYFGDDDDAWKRLTEELERAREDAKVNYVVSHSPCLRLSIVLVLTALLCTTAQTYSSPKKNSTITTLSFCVNFCPPLKNMVSAS